VSPNKKRSAPFVITDYLNSVDDIAAYLNAAIETGDEGVLLAALGHVVKAGEGMTALSRASGLSRESLYRALSEDGNPRLSSLLSVLNTMGLRLSVEPSDNETVSP
jgi:probable addiction module antidote protein